MPVPNRAGGCTGIAPAVSARTRPRGAAMSLVPFRLPQSVARRGRPLAVLAASLVQVGASSVNAAAHLPGPPGQAPTVVLVHGAFADASSWSGVGELLQREGLPVVAPRLPLRGIASDAAYVPGVVNQIDGPVLLVGLSYGGAIISNGATTTPNVVGLVYVSGYA